MNSVTVRFATSTTNWQVIASDGVGYDDLGTLVAADKVPFPGLDSGNHLDKLLISTDNGSGAQGAGVWYHVGGDSAPAAGTFLASGTAEVPGVKMDGSSLSQIRNVWVKKVTGGNGVNLTGIY